MFLRIFLLASLMFVSVSADDSPSADNCWGGLVSDSTNDTCFQTCGNSDVGSPKCRQCCDNNCGGRLAGPDYKCTVPTSD